MAETSFKQAYQVLQQHAETLRNQQEPNIDDLLTIVSESVEAYNLCKTRIDAVEKAMAKALSGARIEESAQAANANAARTGKDKQSAETIDWDDENGTEEIPF